MNIKNILSKVDHTNLSRTATWNDIKQLIDEAIQYNVASICIPSYFIRRAKDYAKDRIKIGTVVGFPNGYSTTYTKVFEAEEAIHNGADEIDMVINTNAVKDKDFDYVLEEIKTIKEAIGDKILKVIVETALLTEEEKIKMCEIITLARAEYIKTSTGFEKTGATFEDIELFNSHIANFVKIKAAGGIKSLEEAEKYIELGVDRLGSTRFIKMIKEYENNN